MLRRGFGGSQEDLERTCLCSTVPTEHGNAASQYASGLHHDLQVAYSRLVRKSSAGKRVPYALTLPGSSFLVVPPHTLERLWSSTRRDSTARPNTAISTYTTTPRDVVPESHVQRYQTSLTCFIGLQLFLLHSSISSRGSSVHSRRPAT